MALNDLRKKIGAAYTGCAVLWLNATLLLVLLNIALGLFFWLAAAARAPKTPIEKYNIRDIKKVYPDRNLSDIKELIKETWEQSGGLKFDSATVFQNLPRSGRFVNIDPSGFRRGRDQGPWPPTASSINIFVYGGSTALGMGVADDETIPSRIQELCAAAAPDLRMCVYNFSVAGFFSTQERGFFEKLLTAGAVPDVVIFLDGLNEFYAWDGEAIFADRFAAIMAGKGDPAVVSPIPIVRAANGLRNRIQHRAPITGDMKPHPPFEDKATNRAICDRWLANRRIITAIARGFDVTPLFVWQPVPGYRYDLRYQALCQGDTKPLGLNLRSRFGYEIMDGLLAGSKDSDDLLWLADMQEGRKENLYVDQWHYTSRFSREIADRIVAHLTQHKLLHKRSAAHPIANPAIVP